MFSKLANRITEGKTILASQIVELLQQNASSPSLYFYCKHDVPTKNTLSAILRALLAQLSTKDNVVASHLYDRCCTRDQTSGLAALEELAGVVFHSQVVTFIILDGLDECEPEEVQKILSWFGSFQEDSNGAEQGYIKLLFIAQRTEIIQRTLSKALQICLENPEHEADVRDFVKHHARTIRDEFEIKPEIEGEIVRRVSNAAKSKSSSIH